MKAKLLSLLALYSLTFPAQSAQAQGDSYLPPEVILPQAAPTASAAPAQAAGGAASAYNTNQATPGQVQMGGGATGFAPMSGMPGGGPGGQPNPFAQRPVDALRQPPGHSFNTRGSGPPAGSSAFGQSPPPAGTSLQSINQGQQNIQNGQGQPAQGQSQNDPVAVMETSKGRVVMRLFSQYAPNTVQAFVQMVNSGFYNGLSFHRVVPGFCVQGGCPNGNGTGNYNSPGTNQPRFLKLEISPYLRHNAAGVLAMARTDLGTDTASCQFYITLGPQPSLDQKYTVFGGVLQGMDVVRSIAIGDKINSITIQN